MGFFSAVVTLLLVMDPLGNVPLFLTALKSVAPDRRMKIVLREALIALVLMVAFLFLGQQILKVLHVSSEALAVGGGAVLLLIAIRMIFPTPESNLHEATLGEPFIVPLAVPYMAGPSLLATEILLVSKDPGNWPFWLGALGLAWAITAVILLGSGYLQRWLGDRALTALERLMGMILVLIATQMMFDGIRQFLHI